MTIRPGQPSRKSPPAGTTKSSSKGMDVVMMNDFEQRHHTNKSRSHSPFGHIGSPTTPLNFEQLFLQGQLPLNSELSQHDQNMLQAQLLNSMRSSGMAPKPKQQSQPSLAMLDQLRQAYNRGEQEQAFSRGDREQAEWNARALNVAAAHQQQHQGQESANEPSTIALLQQKFAQLERHKAEMQKSASQPQQVQIYPSQWPMPVHGNSMQPPPPVSSAAYPESRHFVPTSGGLYSFQQHQPPLQSQVMPPPSLAEVPEQFYSAKQEISWRPTQDTRPAGAGQGWNHGNAGPPSIPEMGNIAPLMYMTQQQGQQFQHQAPKVVDYQSTLQHRVPDFAVPPQASFSSFQLNGPPAPDMTLLSGPVGVSSRCDKTGGHSVEVKSVPDHFRSDDSEMSLDNFSGRVPAHIPQPSQVQSSIPTASQIPFSNNFHMLPQSSKSAFSTFTRPTSNLNPASEAVVTKSLLFNDTYRRSQEMPDLMHDDVDTELHL
ncbi:hypothetical protein M758_10G076300 [Ceratodon purpureus]|nr:hypothetical protein M758_10G076300 [Ceratodon purpureus]